MTILELSTATLEFAGLDETAVTVRIDDTYADKGLDGTAWLGRAKPVIKISSDLDVRHTVATVLHEAAHVLSGDAGHGHRFQEQWRQLSSDEFIRALELHLASVFTAVE